MLIVRRLLVRSLDTDFHEVSWELENTSEDVLDYSFQVLRSESPEGPYTPLAIAFQDHYTFIDNTIILGNRWRQYFYVLRITNKLTAETFDTPPASRAPDPDLIARELRSHMLLLFREFAGRRCWILPARTFGQRCSCWNKTLNQSKRSGCELCFDTGFVRGYLSPIETWVQFDPSAKSEQQTSIGAQQQVNTTARLPYYPPLKPRDIIVEPENRRWRVVQVNQTEQLRAAVHQEVQLHEIPPKDIEFSIPLNLDTELRELSLSPVRNFTNPQNLDSYLDEEVPNIFALYPPTHRSDR